MPRGRHRHSPPLHRLLPPTAIAGVSLVCALGPWVFSEPAVLRVSAAVAAATAAVGAAVMRRWDVEAGKRVADLTRARASDEWRHEEKVAELETDLEESRELRTKLEHKLRAKRAELANLRNEHAALLRRYATAETERASALEGRRLLEIEATAPEGARELTVGGAGTAGTADVAQGRAAAQASLVPPQGVPAPGAPWGARGAAGVPDTGAGVGPASAGGAVAASGDVDADADADVVVGAGGEGAEADDARGEGSKSATGVFSPAGSALWLRANSALERIITQRESAQGAGEVSGEGSADGEPEAEAGAVAAAEAEAEVEVEADAGAEVEAEGEVAVEAETGGESTGEPEAEVQAGPERVEEVGASEDQGEAEAAVEPADQPEPTDQSGDASADEGGKVLRVKDGSGRDRSPKGDPDGPNGGGTRQGRSAEDEAEAERVPVVTAEEDDPAGKPGAVDGHEHAAAEPVPAAPVPAQSELSAETERSAPPAVRPSGHFTVPTAVAVVPATPQRRTAVEGGFDFFGTQKGTDAIEAVQNEDLADVVGQEALALHKAESEARFKRIDEAARGVGQVIDLTAHDETEQIDVQGLRTAAS